MAQIGVDLGSYTFDASAKTITFSGVTIQSIEQIKPIVNGERAVVIFNPAESGKFGSLSNNVLTLDFDTTSYADSDALYICIKEEAKEPFSVDAFGRSRVSELTTLIDIKHLYDKQPLLVDEVLNGTATSVHSTSTSSVEMSTAASGDYAIRQTKQRLNYQNGKSQLILQTFSGLDHEANVTKRIGYFSSSSTAPYTASLDGIFLQSDGTNYSINVYREGTQVFSVNQSSWNLDTMDGNGASGINIDFSKSQILAYDFEWLGVGGIRFAFVVDNKFYYFHKTKNSNVNADVYMASPNQPLRWEIRQSGAGSGDLKTICSTVSSEGAINQVGRVLSSNTGTTALTASSSSNTYACIGIRLKAGNLDTVVSLLDYAILATTSDNYLFEIIYNPTVAGTFTYSDVNDSSVQIATGATANTVTGGTVIFSSYGTGATGGGGGPGGQGAGSVAQSSIDNAIRLGAEIDGTRDEIVLTVTPLTNGLDVYTSINWRELI